MEIFIVELSQFNAQTLKELLQESVIHKECRTSYISFRPVETTLYQPVFMLMYKLLLYYILKKNSARTVIGAPARNHPPRDGGYHSVLV